MSWDRTYPESRHRGIRLLVAVSLAVAVAFVGHRVGAPIHRDLHAARSLKPLLAEGHRLVPVRAHPYLRGEASQDYHCFNDGLCLYGMHAFRRLYPAYNDLEDDVLLTEISERRAGQP